jgi:hypothetical protein
MTNLFSWALALSMMAGAADCCGDPACCAAGCCHHCTHSK